MEQSGTDRARGSAPDRRGPGALDGPGVSWPASGGGIRGIDETFSAGGATGAGSISLPLPVATTRTGGTPPLSLTYSTGGSAGAFGFGWTLNVPAIRRLTSRGVPRYRDGPEPDVFVLADGNELVPKRVPGGGDVVRRLTDTHEITEYLPRTLGGWDRIERWRALGDGRLHWRTISSDNVISIYGASAASCLADPAAPDTRIFAWFLERVTDDRGNTMVLRHKAEDRAGVDGPVFERGRTAANATNLYVKRALYGNRTPSGPDAPPPPDADFMFETVFDYGEHDRDAPTPAEDTPWTVRPDPVSDRRAGFEIRTWRICRRVLLFHRFDELPINPCLVASLDLIHDRVADDDAPPDSPPGPLFVREAVQRGYVFDPAVGGYRSEAAPAMRFHYQAHAWDGAVRTLEIEDLPDGAATFDHGRHRWIDLDGEGAAGLLILQAGAMRYCRNLGGGRLSADLVERDFPATAWPGERVPPPVFHDLDGSGVADLIRWTAEPRGFHARDAEGGWLRWQPFERFPEAALEIPGAARLIDLTGDGVPDILLTETDVMLWHRSEKLSGFGPARRVDLATQEADGPRLVFSDAGENIYLADMTGDGLPDLVRIRDGEVCYWANLGHGRFSHRVTMADPPRLENPGAFNPAMVRLADVDGTGPADILYFDGASCHVWLNQQGNGFAPPRVLLTMPETSELTDFAVVDIMGSGTAAILWASPLARDRGAPVRFVDLMGGVKPWLLRRIENGTGGETEIRYRSATEDYRADRAAGQPWATRLPFPVQVVAEVIRRDHIRNTRFTQRFRYAHGHFDTRERAFRGFGRVEAEDTEDFQTFARSGAANVVAQEHHQPPLRTVVWAHTGAGVAHRGMEAAFRREWFDDGAGGAFPLPATVLPGGLTSDEWLDAQRSLAGATLRTEVFSGDDAGEGTPYSTVTASHLVRLIQPSHGPHPAVFQVLEDRTLTATYERQAADPRIAEQITIARDDRGLVTQAATILYGRRNRPAGLPDAVWAAQSEGRVGLTEADFTGDLDEPDAFRLRVPCETRDFLLTGFPVGADRIAPAALAAVLAAAPRIAFEAEPPGPDPALRLLARSRRLFLADDLGGEAPLGDFGRRALIARTLTLAMTDAFVANRFGGRVDAAMLAAAGYVHADGDADWWLPSAAPVHAADPVAEFFLPIGRSGPVGGETRFERDAHKLMVVRSTDPVGNATTSAIDYRRLGPFLTEDPNGNRVETAADVLGALSAAAVMGKAGAGEGDTIADPTLRIERDRTAWADRRAPLSARSHMRERHGPANPRFQESVAYSDGSGAVLVVKAQAEPGPALRVNPVTGDIEEVQTADRWIGNGRTVLDNKGAPIKQYEPYFSATDAFETDAALVERGATSVQFYDPSGRPVRTLYADGSEVRARYDAWQITRFDANDTVRDTAWYAARGSPDPAAEPEPADPDRRAAWLAAAHHDTPARTHADVLGNAVMELSDLGGATLSTRTLRDPSGRWVQRFDEADRMVEEVFFDMLGRVVETRHAERGTRISLTDARGLVTHLWDGADRAFRTLHDAGGRPTHQLAREGAGPEILLARLVYGESHPDALARNLRGRLFRIYDQTGVTTVERADFRGRETETSRRFLAVHSPGLVDWSAISAIDEPAALDAATAGLLSAETFTARQEFDALGRAVRSELPDGSEILPVYGRDNGVAEVSVRVAGEAVPRVILAGQTRNARGQRETTSLGNGLLMRTAYDPLTYRPVSAVTLPGEGAPAVEALQALTYTYDPSGNVVEVRDAAQQARFFDNGVVAAGRRFVYDALYRLVRAEGREHAALTQPLPGEEVAPSLIPHPNDVAAARRYTETYAYDALGNLVEMHHQAPGAGGTWTRRYRYALNAAPGDRTNRLSSTSRPGDPPAGPFTNTYEHDARGNMTAMNLTTLVWNLLDQLAEIDLGGGGRALYAYGISGARRRKTITRQGGMREERLYLGGLEIFRRFAPGGALRFERRTLHVGDDEGALATLDVKTVDTDGVDPANPVGQPLVRYQLGDLAGSVGLECDAAGGVVTYEEYHPYGSTAYRAARPGSDISLKRYRFSGKERDAESGLYYFGARYYAPSIGRWISPDPAGGVDGPNLFAFCRNNPVTVRDRNGTEGDPPLNPVGEVSWQVPSWVFRNPGAKRNLPQAQIIANFERWLAQAHPERAYSPGTLTIRWTHRRVRIGGEWQRIRVPIFNAEWLDREGRPLLPRRGEMGHVTTWNAQQPAEYDDPADPSTRRTEGEHATPRAQQRQIHGTDEAGNPRYDRNAEGRDPVVRSPRAVSQDKTHGPDGDNAATRQVRQRAASGRPPTTNEIDMESNGRFHRANERQGGPAQTGLRPGSINRGTLEQMGTRFARNDRVPSGGSFFSRIGQAATSARARAVGGLAAGLGTAVAYQTVPFLAETALVVEGAGYAAYQTGLVAAVPALEPVAAAAIAAPGAVGATVLGSAVGGYFVGDAVESWATEASGSRTVGVAAGTAAGAGTGALIGAAVGSVVPILGTAVGAGIGAVVGGIAGFIGSFW